MNFSVFLALNYINKQEQQFAHESLSIGLQKLLHNLLYLLMSYI